MTREREEAIAFFKDMNECTYGNVEHIQMAIKALEQESVLDKIEEEIKDTLYIDSLIFTELIDFKNGKIDADDVIEEFNRVTRMEVLRIIDKYKAESEDTGMKPTNPNSPCAHGCKHSKKCKADKSSVIECGRYKPTEEWTQIMMELKSTINSYNARK